MTPPYGTPYRGDVLALGHKLNEHTKEDERRFDGIDKSLAENSKELGVQTAILTRLEAVVVNGQKLEHKRQETAIEIAGEKKKTWLQVAKGLLMLAIGYLAHKLGFVP